MDYKTKIALAGLSAAALALGMTSQFEDVKRSKHNIEEAVRKIEKNEIKTENKEEFKIYHWRVEDSEYFLPYFICRGKSFRPEGLAELGENAVRLNEISDRRGNHFFTCEDIAKYLRYGGTVDYAQELASLVDSEGNNRFYGAQLPQLYTLGLTPEELVHFKDTEKPNALLVYSAFDKNPKDGSEGAFKTSEDLKFFRQVGEIYDRKVAVISTEMEFCDAIDEKFNFKRLMAVAHGTVTGLQLAEDCSESEKLCDNEKHYLDTGDYELGPCLDRLSRDAVIFLNSCSTAEGGKGAYNFANFMSSIANNRTIIASTIPFSPNEIQIKPPDPFDLRIIRDGIDYTYVVKGNVKYKNYGMEITITSP